MILASRGPKPDDLPPNMLKRCAENKNEIFTALSQNSNASDQTAKKSEVLIGTYLEFQEDFERSHKHFIRAGEIDPKDPDVKVRAWRNFIAFLKSKKKTASIANNTELKKDVRIQIEKLLNPVIQMEASSREQRTGALKDKAESLEEIGENAEAIPVWEELLVFDPRNEKALNRTAIDSIRRNKSGQAIGKIESLIAANPNDINSQIALLKIYQGNKDFNAQVIAAKKFLPRTQNTDIKIFLVQGLVETGAYKEAAPLVNELLKSHGTDPIVRYAKGRMLGSEGDQKLAAGLPAGAMSLYESALKFSPHDLFLKVKMANILYEFRKSRDFQPEGSTLIEMNRALELVQDVLKQNPIKEVDGTIMVKVASRSATPRKAKPACDKLIEDYGSLGPEALLPCALIYVNAGEKEKSKKLLDSAAYHNKYSAIKNEILELQRKL